MTWNGSSELVDLTTGIISRRVFTDDEIYRRELEQIFAKQWLCIGHESQVTRSGDFFTTWMGQDPVFVIRGRDNKVRAFLNSCRHRGMTLCRSDSGNARLLRCQYHSWAYDPEGNLAAVPREDTAYAGQIRKEDWGLIQVAKLGTYQGLIFATWDPDAPSLDEHLGDMKFYLDLMIGRRPGGTEVIGGVQKWTINANWKLKAENGAGDIYHVPTVHGSAVKMGFRGPMGDSGYAVRLKNGHAFAAETGGTLKGGERTAYSDYIDETLKFVSEKHGDAAASIVPVGAALVFPNLFIFDSVRFRMIEFIHPRGPESADVYSWCLVDRDLPEALKKETSRQVSLGLGMFRVDDEDVWRECTYGMGGVIGRRAAPLNYQMGLNLEKSAAEGFNDPSFPGTMGATFPDEGNQRAFYRRWAELMDAEP